jgi:hypothetical protein
MLRHNGSASVRMEAFLASFRLRHQNPNDDLYEAVTGGDKHIEVPILGKWVVMWVITARDANLRGKAGILFTGSILDMISPKD